ncbi:lipid A deacylase LpxR family protein [Chitinophaga sp. Mgbs1]|uniref:Lipid A deacylase LpxR family protein n=1 Tax=Chitinophaga solisilvae TaxID=1233460 RepID=A0A433WEL3_9BACT|nr:lipid A deacylase LpxR family protein [Chitinophaga solisilvae]
MKKLLLPVILCITVATHAQITQNAAQLLRLYEDDDFFNVWGRGTDKGYSNGSSIGYVYMKKKPSVFIDNWLFPKAGKDAVNVFDWALMQIMITPNQIADTSFHPEDYYYAGALFATHGLTSYDPVKKYSLRSEIVFGVLGPWSLAKETQTLFHHIINYQPPEGWEHQVPNSPLLNYNFTYERMVWEYRRSGEVVAGVTGRAGTMITGFTAQVYARYGLINPYFGDTNVQRAMRRKFQLYLMVRPQFTAVAYNALLQGGIFRSRDTNFEELEGKHTSHMRRFSIGLDYGIGIGIGRTSICYTQQTRTAWMSGTGKHSVGNITLLIPLSPSTNSSR